MKNSSKAWAVAAVAFAVIAIVVGSVVGANREPSEQDCYNFCSSELGN